MAYCTIEEIKTDLNIVSSNNDALLARIINQVKDFIDGYCNRTFAVTTAGTKYYDGCSSPLFIDDLLVCTTLKLDEDGDGSYEATMAATDYILYPLNTTPKRYVELSYASDYSGFAVGIRNGVQIVGNWGYGTTIPSDVRGAAIMQSCRWFKRKDSGYATIIGMPETGATEVHHGLDPDIKKILEPYRRLVSGSFA